MPAIPFEILTLTFEQLNCKDLAQCQLVSRSWNQVSLKIFYSYIWLKSEKGCQFYVRTIKGSPHLGKYLEVIGADIVQGKERHLNLWDIKDLLDTVMNHCPNVLKIFNSNPSSSFLTQLINAGLQNRLSRLQYVPYPSRDYFYRYTYLVFIFRKTLTSLALLNDLPQKFFGAKTYPILYKNLNHFPCLQTLKIECYSTYYLSYYDALINKCERLTNLIIEPIFMYNKPSIAAKNVPEIIQAHPNIKALECTWPIVNAENQIAYIMQKFPNLTSLSINYDQYEYDTITRFSLRTLLKLLRYIISLKKGVISVISHLEDWPYPWDIAINEKVNAIDISIFISGPSSIDSDPTDVLICFTGKTMTLNFTSYTDRHIIFLSNIGRKVRSLTLGLQVPHPSVAVNMDQTIKLIESCPSLQHLKLARPGGSYILRNTDYRNFELKSFTIAIYNECDGFLKKISFMFPNLKNLHLLVRSPYGFLPNMTIDMPNASFDSLTCSLRNDSLFEKGTESVYIRLKTDAGLQFYSATKDQLQQINEDGRTFFNFDINCRSIINLIID